MPKHGKKYDRVSKLVDPEKTYQPQEAAALVKQVAYANFDETVEVHFKLGIDPRHADQQVRSTATLPHGTGKQIRVIVFAEGDAARIAREQGIEKVGSDDLIHEIEGGFLDFDLSVAMADQMGKVGKLGRILGRRGLMPNPRSGTVVRQVEDLPQVLSEVRGGASNSAMIAPGCCTSASARRASARRRSPRTCWRWSRRSTASSRPVPRVSTSRASPSPPP